MPTIRYETCGLRRYVYEISRAATDYDASLAHSVISYVDSHDLSLRLIYLIASFAIAGARR